MSASFNLFLMLVLPAAVFALMAAVAWNDRHTGRVNGRGFFQRNGAVVSTYLIIAVSLWVFLTILFPLLVMVDMSFRPNLLPHQRGGPEDHYTLENYAYFLFGAPGSSDTFNTLHLTTFFTTIFSGLCITAFNFVFCYPLAYYLAKSAMPRMLRLIALFLIIPYWINEVLRTFAIRLLLSTNGLVNSALMQMGLIDQPLDFINNNIGLYWGLIYSSILIMVFTLYNSLESLDRSQIEAARDLGAPWWHVHAFIAVPHARPGIASGCSLTFLFCTGSLAAPMVLGGPGTLWFTPVIYNRFYQALNWPQGTAYAVILLVGCMLFVLLTFRLLGLRLGEMDK